MISVIVPVFNCKPYIHECIDSVLSQDYRDFEVICVFDGESISDYGCSAYSSDKRIIMIESDYAGVSESRNIGVSRARGKYIYFLDGDDYLSEGALGRLVETMEANSLDVLNFDADLFVHGKPRSEVTVNRYERNLPVSGVVTGSDMLNVMLENNQFRCPVWLLCIRRAFYAGAGLCFYKGIIHEDDLFTYCCLMNAERTMWVGEKISQHRIREDSIMSRDISHLNLDGYIRVCVELVRFNHVFGQSDLSGQYYDRVLKLVVERGGMLSDDECMLISPLDDESYGIFTTSGDPNILSRVDPRVMSAIIPRDESLFKRLSSDYSEKPAVSIIMPVFNASYYLRDTLDDVLRQSVSNIEFICVDDGSTDDSFEILKEYALKNPNMTVVSQENLFSGAARNTGLDIARGDYVLFLDSDDRFDRRMVEVALGSAFRHSSDVVVFEADVFDSETGERSQTKWMLKYELAPGESFKPSDASPVLFQMMTGVPWNKLFRRDFIVSHGLRFQETVRSNDVFFVLSAVSQADVISLANQTLVHYRRNNIHSLQGTVAATPLAVYQAYYSVKKKLQENGTYEQFRTSFINACILNCVNNLRKIKDLDSVVYLLVHFRDHIFDDLELFGLQQEEVKYPREFAELAYIKEKGALEYLRRYRKIAFAPAEVVGNSSISDILLDYSKVKEELAAIKNSFSFRYGDSMPSSMPESTLEEQLSYMWKVGTTSSLQKLYDTALEHASAGNQVANAYLGRMYFNGKGVEKDVFKAREYYENAPDIDWAVSELIGILWNMGTKESIAKMLIIAQPLADRGHRNAIAHIAKAFRYGKGVERDLPAAADLMRQIYKGNAGWTRDLADILEAIGTPESIEESKAVRSEIP